MQMNFSIIDTAGWSLTLDETHHYFSPTDIVGATASNSVQAVIEFQGNKRIIVRNQSGSKKTTEIAFEIEGEQYGVVMPSKRAFEYIAWFLFNMLESNNTKNITRAITAVYTATNSETSELFLEAITKFDARTPKSIHKAILVNLED